MCGRLENFCDAMSNSPNVLHTRPTRSQTRRYAKGEPRSPWQHRGYKLEMFTPRPGDVLKVLKDNRSPTLVMELCTDLKE